MKIIKKYQVFVSSTFEDLEDERKIIMSALLDADYIPSGMEDFPAQDIKQFDYICKVIKNSDFYILLIGNRYGSIHEETGKSYTEMEYEYAKSMGIPVLAFIIEYGTVDTTCSGYKDEKVKLDNFKEEVRTGRLIKVIKEENELAASVISSLKKCRMSQNLKAGLGLIST